MVSACISVVWKGLIKRLSPTRTCKAMFTGKTREIFIDTFKAFFTRLKLAINSQYKHVQTYGR